MRKRILITLALWILFVVPISVSANQEVGSNFIRTLIKEGEELAKTYVNPDVNIPEIRENTPLREFTGLPSHSENVNVILAYFDDGKDKPERIAFIWEVTETNDQVTNIRVVYDGSNPLMNELNLVKEYEDKHRKNILVPMEFPFAITHVDGYVGKDRLVVRYQNKDLNCTLQLEIAPKGNKGLKQVKGKGDTFYTLEDGKLALFQSNNSNTHRIIFDLYDLRYDISVNTEKVMNVDDLMKMVNSMLANQ